nr:MAG TPA: Helix-turn-helix XRE-family like protein [Caudoviricetes sp.]
MNTTFTGPNINGQLFLGKIFGFPEFLQVSTKIKHDNASKKGIDTFNCACYYNNMTRSIARVKLKGEGGLNIKLRAARETSGKTQAQVAKEAQIAERLYQDYEYDKREPGVRTAIRIARALNSTVEALFGASTKEKG